MINIDAYEEGITAFERQVPRNANPYPEGSDRVDWFHGWDRAKMITFDAITERTI
jgi:ribosome modulation factor